jgi:hypothetical protein
VEAKLYELAGGGVGSSQKPRVSKGERIKEKKRVEVSLVRRLEKGGSSSAEGRRYMESGRWTIVKNTFTISSSGPNAASAGKRHLVPSPTARTSASISPILTQRCTGHVDLGLLREHSVHFYRCVHALAVHRSSETDCSLSETTWTFLNACIYLEAIQDALNLESML